MKKNLEKNYRDFELTTNNKKEEKMYIEVLHTPPEGIIDIIKQEYMDIPTIKEVLIIAEHPELKPNETGAFAPKEKKVIIQLKGCLTNQQFLKRGALIIPSIWFNVLHAIYHEGCHAQQLTHNPDLENEESLTKLLEWEADVVAFDKIRSWSEEHPVIPKLEDMGWLGDKIHQLINTFWSATKWREKIEEEVDMIGSPAIADIKLWQQLTNTFKPRDEQIDESIFKAIETNEIEGIKTKNNNFYITAPAFFEDLRSESETKIEKEKKEKDSN